MPAKGVQQVRQRIAHVMSEISGDKAEAAITEALIIGMGLASTLTPVDTSNLINSQFRRVLKYPQIVVGATGYTAAYAAAVHEMSGVLKGKPRAHFGKTRAGVEFGGGTLKGNYWDPDAEPKFLTKGFERSRGAIDEAVKKRMKI